MKKLIIVTVIAACLALCAAVWPQNESLEETPRTPPPPVVTATEPTVTEFKPETGIDFPTEKEKDEPPQPELPYEPTKEPEPEAEEIHAAPEVQPTPKPKPAPKTETDTDLPPGDMVYVEGFGWVEYEGPNRCEDGSDIYENGNKIGIMG